MGGQNYYKAEGGFSRYLYHQVGEIIEINGIRAKIIEYLGDEIDVVIPSYTVNAHKKYPVKTIEENAFRDRLFIQTLDTGNSVVELKKYCFSGCKNLRRVYLGPWVRTIETGAFNDTAIVSITIPEKIKTCDTAFSNCHDLKSVTIASGALIVPQGLCRGCKELESVSIASSVTEIQNDAFYGCENLQSVQLPPGLTFLGNDVFCESGLLDITIPAKVTATGGAPFRSCRYLQKAVIEKGATCIPNSLFYECRALRNVTIPDTVTWIGTSAFERCISLPKISLPSGITAIYANAFKGCSSISSVVLPNALYSLADSAFEETILESVTIPGKLQATGSRSPFLNCHYLKKAIFKSGVTVIPSNLFKDCVALQTVTIPDTVTSIGASAFSGCVRLTNVSLPNSIVSIEDRAFCDCNSITSVTLPSSLETLGGDAFARTFIRSITIPKTLWKTGSSSPFSGCYSLRKATIKSGMVTIPANLFSGCTTLEEVSIPKSVNTVAANAFNNCDMLIKAAYAGTKAQWRKILIMDGNSAIVDHVKCSDTPPDGTDESGELIWNKDGVVLKGSTYYIYQNGKNKGKYTGWIKKGVYKVYVENGRVSTKSAIIRIKSTRYYIKKGYFQRNYTGIIRYNKVNWYVVKGKVNTSYKGLVPYKGKLWYVRSGKWIKTFNGKVTYKKKKYTVKNGIAQ